MLDQLNKQIMWELRNDGRRSYTELAKVLGVTEGTVRNRVRDLHKRGILKIKAVIDPSALGFDIVSIIAIQVRMADLLDVATMLAEKPNVYYLAFVTGRYDLVAMLISRTPKELSKFIREELATMPSIIRTETFVNLEVVKGPWAKPSDFIELLGESNSVKEE